MQQLTVFWRDERAVLLIKFALFLPVILAVATYSIDYAMHENQKSRLQSAADAAALAVAKKISMLDPDSNELANVAKSAALFVLQANGDRLKNDVKIETTVAQEDLTVEVTATMPLETISTAFTSVEFPDVQARAAARVVGSPNICVLGLNPNEPGTISLEQDARVTGQNCAVFSNSTHVRGLKAKNSSTLAAKLICSRGGKDGGPGNFTPNASVNCPSFEDPLRSRFEPPVADCDPAEPTVVNSRILLPPGTYCGLEVLAGGEVTLFRGVYVFRDKPLIVRDGGTLIGDNAGLFFKGEKAYFTFERGSNISLTAPTDGVMAGLVIFGSGSQNDKLIYSILSDNARKMEGTIYIPRGELRVDATNPIADKSAYTAIVADKMRLYGGPHLILNTDYSATDIPVPEGIASVGQPPILIR